MSLLLGHVRDQLRTSHYSIRTEEAHLKWIRESILFHGKRHPNEMDALAVSRFLSHPARERNVAVSTHDQALSTLLFIYRGVPGKPINWVDDIERARKPQRLPVVSTGEEAVKVLHHLCESSR